MPRPICHFAIVFSVALLVLFTNLGTARLWDRDEPRNAGCAWEMMERGDWVTPMFNDQLRDAKPVLLYWLIMSAYSVIGVTEFAARFWSAALAVGTVLATYAIGRRLFNARVALWSAVILATSLMFDVAGRAATPDSALIFFSTLALMVYVLGTFRGKAPDNEEPPLLRSPGCYFPSSWLVVGLMYAAMGMGVLTKGPVGLVLPTAVIGMFLLIVRLPKRDENQGEQSSWWNRVHRVVATSLHPFVPGHFLRTCWHMRPLTALIIVLLVAGPWYVMVGLRTEGDFLNGFFVKEHFGRATVAMENHSGSVLFYPAAILAGFFPWSVFAIPVIITVVSGIRRNDRWKVGFIIASCWVCVYVAIFTLATTKLPSYVTPCYPALALLTGCFLQRWCAGESVVSRIWPYLSMVALALVGIAFLVGLPLAARRYFPGHEWLGILGALPLVGSIVCFTLMQLRRLQLAGAAFIVMATLFAVSLFGFATVEIDKHQRSHVLFEEIARRSSRPQIGSFGCLESTWVYYTRARIWELTGKSDCATRPQGKLDTRTKPWKRKPRPGVSDFFASSSDAFVITTKDRMKVLEDLLPRDVEILAEAPYFLKDRQLVLLGRKDATRTADRTRHGQAPTAIVTRKN